MIKLSTQPLKISLLTSLFLLAACGGGGDDSTKDGGGNDGGGSQTSDLEIKLPFDLDDDTGKVQFPALLSAAGRTTNARDARAKMPKIDNYIAENREYDDTTPIIVDKLNKVACIDNGSINIQSNLPPAPWYTYTDTEPNPLLFEVSASECYSEKQPNGFRSKKYIDGSVEVKHEDEEVGDGMVYHSRAKYNRFAIGYSRGVPSTKGEKDFESLRRLNILLTGTRKSTLVEGKNDLTGKDQYTAATDILTDTKLEHYAGGEVIIEGYTLDTNETGTNIEFTVKWEVTNTPENIELIGHTYLRWLLDNGRYGKDYIFSKGSYHLHYKYDRNNSTGVTLVTVDLISHSIKAEIVHSKAHTDVTYNRKGNIKTVRVK